MERKQYETGFSFAWNLSTGTYTVVDKEPLTEVDFCDNGQSIWHPARDKAFNLQKTWLRPNSYYNSVKFMTNEPVLQGI